LIIGQAHNNKTGASIKLCYLSGIKAYRMSALSIKQIQQIAREYNVSFEMDETTQLPKVFAEGIILRPSIQLDDRHTGWKMTRLIQRTAMQISKMTEIKNLLNDEQ
jgi:hypothetical protein